MPTLCLPYTTASRDLLACSLCNFNMFLWTTKICSYIKGQPEREICFPIQFFSCPALQKIESIKEQIKPNVAFAVSSQHPLTLIMRGKIYRSFFLFYSLHSFQKCFCLVNFINFDNATPCCKIQ